MAKLDARGYIAIAEIIIYIPVLILSIILVLRHGFTRRAGWIFLVILSLARIIGAIANIASEQNPSNETLVIMYSTLEAAGVSPLLLATLGFLRTVCDGTIDTHPLISKGLKLMGVLAIIALILAITGGIDEGTGSTQSSINEGVKYRHIGDVLFAVLYALIFLLHGFCWMNSGRLLRYRRLLLAGISCALPFLFVRVVYLVLSGFAPVTRSVNSDGQVVYNSSTSFLTKFNGINGEWAIYLFMSVVPEIVTVFVYIAVGTRIPLQRDAEYAQGEVSSRSEQELARLQRPSYSNDYARPV